MQQHNLFIRNDVMPSWWANAIQRRLAVGAEQFAVRRASATTVEVPAAANEGAAIIAIDGKWRWNEVSVSRPHPGGGAGTYAVFVVAKANDIRDIPEPGSDFTDYSFDLRIVLAGSEPASVPGTVDLWLRVARYTWDGAAITSVVQEVNTITGNHLADGTFVNGAVTATRQPGGGFLLEVADGAVTNAKVSAGAAIAKSKLAALDIVNADVNAAAAIAESKLSLASDAAAGVASRRTLGSGALQAAAGNDSRFPAGDLIVNADVDGAAAIAEGKLNLATDAAAGVGSRRTLGAGATQAAAGNDSRFPAGADIINADVGAGAAIAESKLALASDAAAGTPSRRTLGAGATQAAAGNDARLSDQRSPAGPEAGLRIVRGRVSAAGAIVRGGGWTVAHTLAGVYTITFSSALGTAPVVVVAVDGSDALGYARLEAVADFEVFTGNAGGVAQDRAFSFIAIG